MRRRDVVLALASTLACGPPSSEGWVEVPLSEVPALREVGGSAVVRRPEALLDLQVLRLEAGVAALWHLCTHGACEVEVAEGPELVCPCHGSRFATDGAVLEGPATRPLRRFEAVIAGDSLFVRR